VVRRGLGQIMSRGLAHRPQCYQHPAPRRPPRPLPGLAIETASRHHHQGQTGPFSSSIQKTETHCSH
jgi:hypothetical protein